MQAMINTAGTEKLRSTRSGSFEELALPLQDELLRTARGMTGNENDAEDLVQESLLTAYRFFHRYRQGTNFRAWIFTVLRNTFINNYRSSKRRPKGVPLDTLELMNGTGADTLKSEASHLSEESLDSPVNAHLREALEKLPETSRRAIVLCDISGYKYREIAEILSIPVGTVMSKIFRARQALKKYLEEDAA